MKSVLNWLHRKGKQLALVPRKTGYYSLPGIRAGNWPIETRLRGLEELLGVARGKSVLDLGCAEGMISREFCQHGAAAIHGFEINLDQVRIARREVPKAAAIGTQIFFRRADIGNWDRFVVANRNLMLKQYDIVLLLAVLEKLPESNQDSILDGLMAFSRCWIALRIAPETRDNREVLQKFSDNGFELAFENDGVPDDPSGLGTGWLGIFRRRSANS